ncbi:hypothetical protein TNCV_1277501 [Trichonephila clavipes]|nr:hypothetical protein TNCV_1277501 [Trichonephila clavipes]
MGRMRPMGQGWGIPGLDRNNHLPKSRLHHRERFSTKLTKDVTTSGIATNGLGGAVHQGPQAHGGSWTLTTKQTKYSLISPTFKI